MALAQQMDKHQRLMVVVGSLVRDLPKKTWAPKCPGPFYSVRRAMRRSVDQTGARLRNDQAHLPARLSELRTPESLHAPPVRCSAWFGLLCGPIEALDAPANL